MGKDEPFSRRISFHRRSVPRCSCKWFRSLGTTAARTFLSGIVGSSRGRKGKYNRNNFYIFRNIYIYISLNTKRKIEENIQWMYIYFLYGNNSCRTEMKNATIFKLAAFDAPHSNENNKIEKFISTFFSFSYSSVRRKLL